MNQLFQVGMTSSSFQRTRVARAAALLAAIASSGAAVAQNEAAPPATAASASAASAPAAAASTPYAPADTTLAPIKVKATAEAGAKTETSGAYGTGKVTLFKGERSIRDIPQPVTVITRQLIEDRKLIELHDVMQNTPGVTVDYTDTERVNYNSRGHAIDSLQIDGLSINQSGSIFIQPDTATLDRVEVLRGATGMLRGSGNPSAAVNMVRKRPTQALSGSADVTLGSWNRRRVEGDISTPINEAGTVRARAVAVLDKKEFFQKIREEDRKVFYGVVDADLGPKTRLTGSFQHSDLDATGAWGNIPRNFDGTPLDLPRDLYLGAAWNQWNRYNTQTFVELEHEFDNAWKLRISRADIRMRMKDQGFKQSYFTRTSTTNPYEMTVTSSVYTGDASDQYVTGVTATGPFTLFGRKHELIVGAETQRVKTTPTVGVGNLNPVVVDIRNWDPNSYPEPFPTITATGTVNVIEQKGVYSTASLSLVDRMKLMLGGRASWWEYRIPSNPTSSANYKVTRELTPYAGLTYDLTDAFTVYTSYTEIFSPQNAYSADGNILAPIRGKDYEAGFKGEFFDGRLGSQLSFFLIDNIGKAVEDTSSPNPCTPYYTTGYCRIAGGETRSQGVELDLTGEVLPGWQMQAGYTNTRTRYIRDTSASNVGQPLRTNDPKHLLRLFTSYRLNGAGQGWTIGGGAQAQSDAYTTASGITVRQGGYTIYNAMVGYRFNKHYALQFNVNNLTDKVYFKKYASTGISNYYGDPRNVMLTLKADL